MRVLAAAALLLLLPPPGEGAPTGGACETQDNGAWRCEWRDDNRATTETPGVGAGTGLLQIPTFPRTLARITIGVEGQDTGWTLTIVRQFTDENGTERYTSVGNSRHPAPLDGGAWHAETYVHVIQARPGDTYHLSVQYGYVERSGTQTYGTAPALGEYRIIYEGTAIPLGEPPARPAATRDDPHLVDGPDDARRPEYDLRAAWFDDARLGDGLLDAHLAVTSLEEIRVDAEPHRFPYVLWRLPFAVPAGEFELWWFAQDPGELALGCNLRRVTDTTIAIIGYPRCTFDRETGEMSAEFPEALIGPPGEGVPFRTGPAWVEWAGTQLLVEDSMSEVRYDFALGGPDVWSRLDGGRKDPPPAVALAWYDAPLARENIPDTLQVVGAGMAILTFLGGVVVVRRSRRATRELLERIDRIERAHEADARRALLELGRLESDLTRAFREGRLKDGAYQVATTRIATVAARLALRRDLGLDDGVPDGARRIPIQTDPHAPRREAP